MTVVHLTEEQLQQFAETPDSLGPEETSHISKCESCRFRAQNYSVLYAGLSAMEKPAFDFDLAALLVEQLPLALRPSEQLLVARRSAPKSKYHWAAILCACAGILFMMLMIFIYSLQLVALFNRLPGIGLYMVIIPASTIFLLQCFAYLKEYKRNLIFADRSHQLLE